MNCARRTCGHSEAAHAPDADPKALPHACIACHAPPCHRFIVEVDVDEEAQRQADETRRFDLSDEITIPERKP